MKSLLIIIAIFMSCASNQTGFEISISSLKESDKPYPIIVLTNKNIDKVEFPKHYYQIEQKDFEKIEKECSIKGQERRLKLILIEIKKNNKIEKYFFNRKESIDILNSIQKLTSYYNNEDLAKNLLYLQKVTEN
ncbi:hypothetical protein J2810_004789 [Chryseobacterium rhizosphaerae]|uniref:hypothetical protein n=1 Tax=Chryseobacterium rhizosphaerae TaxID=395937 RepID=UPI002861A731|nr:hypothetical protein [Chryseobacterium rhizosphaerae]MDR6548699.1 hypothetical protein [Chryseobacterium rhizosphaerae]